MRLGFDLHLELLQIAVASRAGTPGGFPDVLAMAGEILRRPDTGFSEFCFVVDGFIFACLFLRGRLKPVWLA